MAELLKITPHLTPAAFDSAFAETYLGQAHIAGSGPAGTTCRECRYWYVIKQGEPTCPGFYAATGLLKPGKCHYPMPHKANRLFPHFAKTCRLFTPTENPYPPAAPAEDSES